MASRVAVVTDSTSCLPAADVAAYDIRVVPLRVTLGHRVAVDDGVDAAPSDVTRALREKFAVSTSRPSPAQFVETYRTLLGAGATHVVSVHLSAALSGTWESAVLAAQEFPYGAVRVVDSRSSAMGLGFAALAAARCAADGGGPAAVQGAATEAVDAIRTLFYVDTLDYLRRGGRIGAAAALFGTSLSIKPLLQMVEGQIVPLEKVRTSSRAIARLRELAVQTAGDGVVSVAVHHLDAPQRANGLLDALRESLPRLRDGTVSELGPVIGAHLGPGALGIVLLRH